MGTIRTLIHADREGFVEHLTGLRDEQTALAGRAHRKGDADRHAHIAEGIDVALRAVQAWVIEPSEVPEPEPF